MLRITLKIEHKDLFFYVDPQKQAVCEKMWKVNFLGVKIFKNFAISLYFFELWPFYGFYFACMVEPTCSEFDDAEKKIRYMRECDTPGYKYTVKRLTILLTIYDIDWNALYPGPIYAGYTVI